MIQMVLAIYTCLTTLNTNHEISIPIQGSLDDLDQLTLQDIQNVYSAYLKADKHIFVCGCLDEEMKTYLERIDSSSKLNSTRSYYRYLIIRKKLSKRISHSPALPCCMQQVQIFCLKIL